MNEYFPTVVQVIPLDNFHVQVFFDDGKIVDYDATEDLKAEIFKPLRDIDAFKEEIDAYPVNEIAEYVQDVLREILMFW